MSILFFFFFFFFLEKQYFISLKSAEFAHSVLSVNGLIKNFFFVILHVLYHVGLNGMTNEYLQIMFGCIINKSYPITRHTRYCTFILILSKIKKKCALCEEIRAVFKSTSYLQTFCHWPLLLRVSSLGTGVQGKMFAVILYLRMQLSIQLWQPVHQYSQVTFIWNTLSCSTEVSKVYVQCTFFWSILFFLANTANQNWFSKTFTREKLSDWLVQISFECKSNNQHDCNKVSEQVNEFLNEKI